MYNVTMKGARVTIVAVEKGKVLHFVSVNVCSLRFRACNAHAPNCHLWSRSTIFFPHFLKNDFRNVTEHKMCFDFLYNFCPKHFSF